MAVACVPSVNCVLLLGGKRGRYTRDLAGLCVEEQASRRREVGSDTTYGDRTICGRASMGGKQDRAGTGATRKHDMGRR